MTESYGGSDGGDIVIMHSLGTVGICLLCVSKHLQSLAEKNCNYRLELQFPLCAVADGKIKADTDYGLNLQACITGDSLQLRFKLTSKTSKISDLGAYTIPISSGKTDLEKMTHLSCRITQVKGGSKTGWMPLSWMLGGAVDNVKSHMEFIGPETPHTANTAREAAIGVETEAGNKVAEIHFLYLMNPEVCRIVAEHNNPRITDLSTIVPREVETGDPLEVQKFHQRLRAAHLNASPQNRSESTFKALQDAFPGVIGRERGVVSTQPKLHMHYNIRKPIEVQEAMQKAAMLTSIPYDEVHMRLFEAWTHVCGWRNKTLYQPVPSKTR